MSRKERNKKKIKRRKVSSSVIPWKIMKEIAALNKILRIPS